MVDGRLNHVVACVDSCLQYFHCVFEHRVDSCLESFRETGAKKSHVLKVDQSGRVALNVVDNLVILHHQPSQVRNMHF